MRSLAEDAPGALAADEVERPVCRGVTGLRGDLLPVESDMPWIIER
jgi:hypothetical protein